MGDAGLAIPPDLDSLVKSMDTDGSGSIDYAEFLAATLEKHQYITEDICWKAFTVFDLNGDGKISRQELETVLNAGGLDAIVAQRRRVCRIDPAPKAIDPAEAFK